MIDIDTHQIIDLIEKRIMYGKCSFNLLKQKLLL